MTARVVVSVREGKDWAAPHAHEVDVYIGGECHMGGHDFDDSPWANPYRAPGDGALSEVIDLYRRYIIEGLVVKRRGKTYDGRGLRARLHELDGKTLGCWCAGDPKKYKNRPDVLTTEEPHYCHGQVLLRLAREMAGKPSFTYDGSGLDFYFVHPDGSEWELRVPSHSYWKAKVDASAALLLTSYKRRGEADVPLGGREEDAYLDERCIMRSKAVGELPSDADRRAKLWKSLRYPLSDLVHITPKLIYGPVKRTRKDKSKITPGRENNDKGRYKLASEPRRPILPAVLEPKGPLYKDEEPKLLIAKFDYEALILAEEELKSRKPSYKRGALYVPPRTRRYVPKWNRPGSGRKAWKSASAKRRNLERIANKGGVHLDHESKVVADLGRVTGLDPLTCQVIARMNRNAAIAYKGMRTRRGDYIPVTVDNWRAEAEYVSQVTRHSTYGVAEVSSKFIKDRTGRDVKPGQIASVLVPEPPSVDRSIYTPKQVIVRKVKDRKTEKERTKKTIIRSERAKWGSVTALKRSKPPAGSLQPETIANLRAAGVRWRPSRAHKVMGPYGITLARPKKFGIVGFFARERATLRHIEEVEYWRANYKRLEREETEEKRKRERKRKKDEAKRPRAKNTALLVSDGSDTYARPFGTPVYALPDKLPFSSGENYFPDGTPKISRVPSVRREACPAWPYEKIVSLSVPYVVQAKVTEANRGTFGGNYFMEDGSAYVSVVWPSGWMYDWKLKDPIRARQYAAGVMRYSGPRTGILTADPYDEPLDYTEADDAAARLAERYEGEEVEVTPEEEAEQAEVESIEEEQEAHTLDEILDRRIHDTQGNGVKLSDLYSKIMGVLTGREHTALYLAYADELDNDVAAERMGISTETFQKHVNNARRKVIETTGYNMKYRNRGTPPKAA